MGKVAPYIPQNPPRTMTIEERAAFEGDCVAGIVKAAITGSTVIDLSAASFPYTIGLVLTQNGVDRALYLPSVTITTNKTLLIRLQWGLTQTTQYGPAFTHSFSDQLSKIYVRVVPGTPVTVPVNRLIRTWQGSALYAYIEAIEDADKTGVQLAISSAASQITDDLNFSAKRVALIVGDSIPNGSGASHKEQMMSYQLIQQIKGLGVDLRYINNSVGGFASYDAELLRQFGRYDYDSVDYFIYWHGTNNAVRNVSEPASYTADLTTMYNWVRGRWGNTCKFIVIGATPLNNTTNEGYLAAVRTAGSGFVTTKQAAGDINIFWLNLGGAGTFDRTVAGNYINTDGVHPIPSAQATVITNIITPWITANAAALKAF